MPQEQLEKCSLVTDVPLAVKYFGPSSPEECAVQGSNTVQVDQPGAEVSSVIPTTWEVKAGALQVRGQSGNLVGPCLKRKRAVRDDSVSLGFSPNTREEGRLLPAWPAGSHCTLLCSFALRRAELSSYSLAAHL